MIDRHGLKGQIGQAAAAFHKALYKRWIASYVEMCYQNTGSRYDTCDTEYVHVVQHGKTSDTSLLISSELCTSHNVGIPMVKSFHFYQVW